MIPKWAWNCGHQMTLSNHPNHPHSHPFTPSSNSINAPTIFPFFFFFSRKMSFSLLKSHSTPYHLHNSLRFRLVLFGLTCLLRFRVQGSRFRVQGSGFGLTCLLGFRVQGSGFGLTCLLGFKVQGLGFGLTCLLGCRVQGSGFGLTCLLGFRV